MLTYGLFLHFNSKYSYDSFSLLLLWVLMTIFISVSVSNTGSILQFQKYASREGKGGEMVVGGDLIWMVSTQHTVQMMHYRTVHLKTVEFCQPVSSQ